MELATAWVEKKRQIKALDAQAADLKAEVGIIETLLLEFIEKGEFPSKSRVNGATVYLKSQVWAGPDEGDHESLTNVLSDLGLVEYLPSKVNTQSLSAFVREHLDPDETLELSERLASPNPKPLDPKLLAALKITDRISVGVNGL